ncbi:hypothetical protein [Nocardia sp. NPDC056000]|uniref:hypothetical protein n=1 Tax=Nocardia sp. NPDC056000 TaxID=3345674 RepID=UPI0035DC5492
MRPGPTASRSAWRIAITALAAIRFAVIEGPEQGWTAPPVLVAITIAYALAAVAAWRSVWRTNPRRPAYLSS